MADILVRNLDNGMIVKLKMRATKNHRSLQSEVKMILDQAASEPEPISALEAARRIRRSNTKKNQTNSVDLLREDRMR